MARELELRCTNAKCRLLLTAPSEYRGRQVRCPGCGEKLVVPLGIVRSLPARRKAG
ncbi:MAG: hypothetical protein WC869_12395 [Phycisphaerae bacterium]|jgi:DNA-directed RNA polymerase subunit RPC12/RpoP